MEDEGPPMSIKPDFTKIIDNLYLTSAQNMTEENLVNFNVTHIVNATKTVPCKRNYQYMRVGILDSNRENIHVHFDPVSDFINSALENNGIVAVHCISGISRSSTLVIAFLMKYRQMHLREAFDFVHSKRKFIRPNTGFFTQLIEYERKLYGNNTVSMVWDEKQQSYIPDFILEDISQYRFLYLVYRRPLPTPPESSSDSSSSSSTEAET